MRRSIGPMVLLGVLAVAGCGPADEKVKTYPVAGQVTYDGKPAAGVQVYLVPTSAPAVPQVPVNPHGVTGPDGRFALATYGPQDGAAEGGYQVVMVWPPEQKDGDDDSKEDRLFGWYSAVHSKLSVRVKPEDNVIPPFQLPARKGKPADVSGIPGKN